MGWCYCGLTLRWNCCAHGRRQHAAALARARLGVQQCGPARAACSGPTARKQQPDLTRAATVSPHPAGEPPWASPARRSPSQASAPCVAPELAALGWLLPAAVHCLDLDGPAGIAWWNGPAEWFLICCNICALSCFPHVPALPLPASAIRCVGPSPQARAPDPKHPHRVPWAALAEFCRSWR